VIPTAKRLSVILMKTEVLQTHSKKPPSEGNVNLTVRGLGDQDGNDNEDVFLAALFSYLIY